MDWKMLLIGAGASAGIMSMLGNKLQKAWIFLTSWMVERHKLDEDSLRLLMAWWRSDGWKPIPFQSMNYYSPWLMVNSCKAHTFVPTKTLKAESKTVVLRKGRKFVSISFKTNWYDNTVATVSFLRFAFGLDGEIKKASEYWRKVMLSRVDAQNEDEACFGVSKTSLGIKGKRFSIRRHYGVHKGTTVFKMDSKDDNEKKSPNAMLAEKNRNVIVEIATGEREVVGYSSNDICQTVTSHSEALDTLALPAACYALISELKLWKTGKAWFEERKLPWRRGWLLWSEPGNGKSSLVRALGISEDLPIHIIDLSTMNNTEFIDAWLECVRDQPCIVLIEDIDGTFRGRDNVGALKDDDALTFDCFLNAISGVDCSDGVFLIVTTNNIQFLDPALGCVRTDRDPNGTMISTRPGRLDRVLKMDKPDEQGRTKMAMRILQGMSEEAIMQCVATGEGDSGAQFQERCSQVAIAHFYGSGIVK